jgi:hypothetical protein
MSKAAPTVVNPQVTDFVPEDDPKPTENKVEVGTEPEEAEEEGETV